MKKNKINRSDVQFAFFIIAVLVTVNHSLIEVGKGISWLSSGYIHYVCPVCGITTIYQFFASNADWMTKLTNPVTWVIISTIIMAIFFGPIFCGWICPFGGFQDFVAGLGKKVFKKKYNNFVSQKVDRALRWLRYVSLVMVVYMVSKSMVTLLESVNPYHALLNLFVGEFVVIGLIFLVVIILASLFIQRPWCKYLCPYGAFLGIFNIFRVKAVVRNESTCVNCKKCSKACPMNIEVAENVVVRDHQCISCLECTSNNACPVEDTVNMTSTRNIKETIKFNARNIAAMILTLVALIAFTAAVVTDSSESGDDIDVSGITIELDGEYQSGTYTGTGIGFNSGLTVEVTIANNQITNIDIISHNETIGYYEEAFDTVPNSIISKQSIDVDVVSGATRSSEGIMEAVEDALSQAYISGGDSANETTIENENNNQNAESDTAQNENNSASGQQNQNNAGENESSMFFEGNIDGDYNDGIYTGLSAGYNGDIVVEVLVDGGSIISIEIIENDETPAFLESAVFVLEDMFSQKSTSVDTITGATISSEAIIEAVNMALQDAK